MSVSVRSRCRERVEHQRGMAVAKQNLPTLHVVPPVQTVGVTSRNGFSFLTDLPEKGGGGSMFLLGTVEGGSTEGGSLILSDFQ